MIKITPILTSLFLLSLLSGSSYAITKSTDIDLSFTHTEYVNLTGTAVGASRFFSINDVKPVGSNFGPKVSLGTLGIMSNVLGSCTLNFTSTNNFRLRHIISNKILASYRLFYKAQKITRNNNDYTATSCNINPRKLKLSTNKRFRKKAKAGIYQDIVTVTVTTQ